MEQIILSILQKQDISAMKPLTAENTAISLYGYKKNDNTFHICDERFCERVLSKNSIFGDFWVVESEESYRIINSDDAQRGGLNAFIVKADGSIIGQADGLTKLCEADGSVYIGTKDIHDAQTFRLGQFILL